MGGMDIYNPYSVTTREVGFMSFSLRGEMKSELASEFPKRGATKEENPRFSSLESPSLSDARNTTSLREAADALVSRADCGCPRV